MNYSTAIFIASDEVKTVGVCFNDNGPSYTFKTTLDLKEGDVVIVENDKAHTGHKVVVVTELDSDIDMSNSTIEYKWVVQKLDTKYIEQTKEVEAQAIKQLKQAERVTRRKQIAEAMGINIKDVKAISFKKK